MVSSYFSSNLPKSCLIWLAEHRQSFYRAMVITVVLSVCVSPLLVSPRLSQLAAVLMVAAGGAVTLLRWPVLGILAIIPTSQIVPFTIGTGTGTAINATVMLLCGLLGLTVLDVIIRRRSFSLVNMRVVHMLLLFVLVTLLSFIIGQLPWFAVAPAPLRAQIGGVFVFVLSAAAFLLVAHRVNDLRVLEWLTWPFLILGGIYIAGYIVPGLWRVTDRLFQYGATGSLFWTWLAALAFGQLMFNRHLHPLQRFGLAILLVGLFYVGYMVNRDWKSGWVPPFAAMTACLVAYVWRWGNVLTVIGLLPVGALVSNLIASDAYSYSTRWDAWIILANIIQVNPIFGLGPANYYWYTSLFPIRGYTVKFNSHSQYVDVVAQTGILGLLCFLWFIWEVGRLGWRTRTLVPEGFARGYAFGALGGLVGTLVASALGDWFLPFVYNIGIAGMRASILGWVFLGGLVALARIVETNASSSLDREKHAAAT